MNKTPTNHLETGRYRILSSYPYICLILDKTVYIFNKIYEKTNVIAKFRGWYYILLSLLSIKRV